jgi:hypothetical protein
MLQPEKVATPNDTVLGLLAQVSVAPDGLVRARVTEALLVVTAFPPASVTVALGCTAKAVAATVVLDGAVVNWSLAAGPVKINTEVLTAVMSAPDRAVRV